MKIFRLSIILAAVCSLLIGSVPMSAPASASAIGKRDPSAVTNRNWRRHVERLPISRRRASEADGRQL
jgi:hypothetical protein